MGRRNHAETLIAIVDAFHEQHTWTQDGLAKRVGVTPRAVRAQLELLLETKRFPLERIAEGRHVYWSLPRRWVAGGINIAEDDIAPLARLVARAPRSAFRDRVVASLLACAPPRVPRPVEPDTITAPPRSDFEDRMLARAESAAAQRVPLSVRYYTASRGELTTRTLSVQRIDVEPPAQLLAHCHKAGELRTFRVSHIRGAVEDRDTAFVRVDEEELDRYVRESVGRYHGAGNTAIVCRFFVRDPDALWVEHNLLSQMQAVRVEGGIEVTVETKGIERVAPFVVGLGGAAVVATPALREHVRALAEGALRAMAPPGEPTG
jgi:predicted DNA-binding transcriptional regulator YafY